ncbi:uncharacterized protein [Gossypium hirsutum]|uniref:Uncharacterized protein n=1 Tax=Gossypium hirsutum TaxID=3635 RepID=A0ABM3BDP3_GOSHI|nr:uncharacterized protein LOC107936981 [Gossypium hirsutum]
MTHRKKDGNPMTPETTEIMEKLKDKKAECDAMPSSDSSVNVDDIDNMIITEVLGPERYGRVWFQGSFISPSQYFGSSSQQYMPSGSQAQAEVQRLRDQMAQMQATTVEQITQLKAEAASREAEVQKRYEELQLQLKADAAAREAKVQRKYEELQLQLKAEAAAREVEAAAREADQHRKYDELQQQLQTMMNMFQQSQRPPY